MSFRPIRGYEDPSRYPSTEFQLRHIFNGRDTNGLADAFRKRCGRVLFDPDRLQELLAAAPDAVVPRSPRLKLSAPRRRRRGRSP
jgi:hypothetical protein